MHILKKKISAGINNQYWPKTVRSNWKKKPDSDDDSDDEQII